MKCHECGGPCRKKDTKKVGRRIGRGVRYRNRKAMYKTHRVCDFCRKGVEDAYFINVLREEIRKLKK